ncbi:MAG: co-chaperone GroES [Planctomycetota bacterium]
MATKIVPLNEKILVKRIRLGQQDRWRHSPSRQRQGKNLAKGRSSKSGERQVARRGKRSQFQVKAGNRVLFTSYAGSEVEVDGEEYLIMTEDDILAVVD